MGEWKSGLCSCFDDVPTCVLGCFCPCYLFGQNAEQLDGSSKYKMCAGYCLTAAFHACCILHIPNRKKLREKYSIAEKPSDLLITCFCSACAICQEAREMHHQGAQPGMPIISSQPR